MPPPSWLPSCLGGCCINKCCLYNEEDCAPPVTIDLPPPGVIEIVIDGRVVTAKADGEEKKA